MDNLNPNFDSFIFTHIPKCGGTSFRKYLNHSALASSISKKYIYIPEENGLKANANLDQLNTKQLNKFKSQNYKVVAMHAPYGFHKDYMNYSQNPFYFTLLRDPIERFISHYYFFNYGMGNQDCKDIPLNDLPLVKLKDLLTKLSNVTAVYMTGSKSNDLGNFKEAKEVLLKNYVGFGILERLPESLDLLNKLSPSWLKLDAQFPNINQTKKSKVKSEEISQEILDLIKTYNRTDANLYKWALLHFEELLYKHREY